MVRAGQDRAAAGRLRPPRRCVGSSAATTTGPTSGLDRAPPDMDDHRLAANVGERLARQAGRGHAGGNEDDRIDHECFGKSLRADSGLIRVAKSRAKRLINAEPGDADGRSSYTADGSRRSMNAAELQQDRARGAGVDPVRHAARRVQQSRFRARRPAVPGYALPSSADRRPPPPAAAAPKEPPLPVLLAKADAKKGEQDAKVCTTCHNFEKGAGAKIGPPLWDVVGRPVASFAGLRLFRFDQEDRRRLDLR